MTANETYNHEQQALWAYQTGLDFIARLTFENQEDADAELASAERWLHEIEDEFGISHPVSQRSRQTYIMTAMIFAARKVGAAA